jgi:hypothetical protein
MTQTRKKENSGHSLQTIIIAQNQELASDIVVSKMRAKAKNKTTKTKKKNRPRQQREQLSPSLVRAQ